MDSLSCAFLCFGEIRKLSNYERKFSEECTTRNSAMKRRLTECRLVKVRHRQMAVEKTKIIDLPTHLALDSGSLGNSKRCSFCSSAGSRADICCIVFCVVVAVCGDCSTRQVHVMSNRNTRERVTLDWIAKVQLHVHENYDASSVVDISAWIVNTYTNPTPVGLIEKSVFYTCVVYNLSPLCSVKRPR